MDLPEWYNPELTIKEMANRASKTFNAVSRFLRRHNLKCKCAKMIGVPSWYNENMTAIEMAELANKNLATISKYLNNHGLPYKRKKGIRSKGYKTKYSFEYFMRFYDKNLTAREMSLISNIPERNIRNYLVTHKLEYYKVRRQLEIGDWYNPSLTLSEMAFASGIAKNDLVALLHRRQLPYIKIKHESKTAVL